MEIAPFLVIDAVCRHLLDTPHRMNEEQPGTHRSLTDIQAIFAILASLVRRDKTQKTASETTQNCNGSSTPKLDDLNRSSEQDLM